MVLHSRIRAVLRRHFAENSTFVHFSPIALQLLHLSLSFHCKADRSSACHSEASRSCCRGWFHTELHCGMRASSRYTCSLLSLCASPPLSVPSTVVLYLPLRSELCPAAACAALPSRLVWLSAVWCFSFRPHAHASELSLPLAQSLLQAEITATKQETD
jgi:hypothetical protein